jgi:hypothetical protein
MYTGWLRLRWEVLQGDEFTCRYCGQFAPMVVLEVDHVVPVATGGTNEKENLITSCSACNRGKSALRQTELLTRVRAQRRERKATLADKIVDSLAQAPTAGLHTHELEKATQILRGSLYVVLSRLWKQGKIDKRERRWLLPES